MNTRAASTTAAAPKGAEVSKEAMVLLKDTPEFEKAKSYVIFYNTVLSLGRQIK